MTNVSQERLSEHIELVQSALYIADAGYHLRCIVDELKRLEAERDRYKAALEKIAGTTMSMYHRSDYMAANLLKIAREALEGGFSNA
jgi:predicted metallo-beta-lactamase superfamily hydrolase